MSRMLRAAAAGAAVCVIAGLAGCGTVTAGAERQAARRSPSAIPAGHQPAAAPGPPSAAAGGTAQDGLDVPLCGARARPDRVVVTLIGGLPPSPPRAEQRAKITIAGAPAGALAAALCRLPTMTHALVDCPNDAGGAYRMEFSAGGRVFPPVTAEVSGCRIVTGLGPVRLAGAVFWHELRAVLAGHGPVNTGGSVLP